MTLVVPFDGSDLSQAALVRAAQFDTVLDDGVVAVSVIPADNAKYARERGWIGPDEPFDGEAVVAHLREEVAAIAPDADFEYATVDRWAPRGTIAKRLRRAARDADASIVFLGSENAGRVVSSLSVGSTVATDSGYDVMIVSQVAPSKIEALEASVPTDELVEKQS